jgi:hypothetical protein
LSRARSIRRCLQDVVVSERIRRVHGFHHSDRESTRTVPRARSSVLIATQLVFTAFGCSYPRSSQEPPFPTAGSS